MTDSVITESSPPTNADNLPPPPSYDETQHRGEFQRNSHAASSAAESVTATAADQVNGYSEPADEHAEVTPSGENVISSKSADVAADCAKFPPPGNLRTSGLVEPNVGNSSSAVTLLVTNGHTDA